MRYIFSVVMVFYSFNLNAFGILADTTTAKNRHLLMLPVIYRSPETKLALGVACSFTFKLKRSDSLTRSSNLQVLGLRTTRKQSVFGVEGISYLPHEKYIIRFHGTYSDYPDRYWGLGNNTPRHRVERYGYTQCYVFPQVLKKVKGPYFIGVSYEFQRLMRFEYVKGGIIDEEQVPGTRAYSLSGVGIIFSHDSRNNAFSSTRGRFTEISITDFSRFTGSDFSYTNYLIDLRKYILVNSKDVIALQAYGNFNTGIIPLISMACMGGSSIMRGYYSGRFRDHNFMALQSEYRLQVTRKFALVGFIGSGVVTRSMARYIKSQDRTVPDRFKISGGGGIRLALKEKERLNLRIDYGIAKNSSGVYITVSEAF